MPARSTTALGDWYANLLFTRPTRLLLWLSEASRLPVVMPARHLSNVVVAFPEALVEVLEALGFGRQEIARERQAMSPVVIAATDSRSMLGSLNEFGRIIKWRLAVEPARTPLQLAIELSEVLVSPLGYQYPREVAARLLRTGRR